jgi:hypothetical protein
MPIIGKSFQHLKPHKHHKPLKHHKPHKPHKPFVRVENFQPLQTPTKPQRFPIRHFV